MIGRTAVGHASPHPIHGAHPCHAQFTIEVREKVGTTLLFEERREDVALY